MIRKIYGKIAAGSLLLAAMTLLVPLTASAQDAERSYNQVRTITVKADKVGEFVELQQQFKAALETAGRSGRGVWQEVRGDQNIFLEWCSTGCYNQPNPVLGYGKRICGNY